MRARKRDPAWSRWLVAAIVDFVVWAERPTGVVDEDTAQWLASCLHRNGDGKAYARTTLIAREILEEAQAFENEALVSLAGMCRSPEAAGRRPRAHAVDPVLAHPL